MVIAEAAADTPIHIWVSEGLFRKSTLDSASLLARNGPITQNVEILSAALPPLGRRPAQRGKTTSDMPRSQRGAYWSVLLNLKIHCIFMGKPIGHWFAANCWLRSC
jgi:hypothetical protein